MSEDKELKQWKEKLFYQPKNGYDRIDAEQAGEIFAYAEGYKQFLNAARTEREAVTNARNGLATIFGYYVNDPERFGIVEFDKHGRVLSVEEKPAHPKSNYCIRLTTAA